MLQSHAAAAGRPLPYVPLPGGGTKGHWRYAEIAIRSIVPLGSLVIGGASMFLFSISLQEGSLWLVRRFSGRDAFLVRLFVGAFLLRAALSLGLHAILSITRGDGALLQDDYTYNLVALTLTRIAQGDGVSVYPGHQHLLENVYIYFLAGLYAVVGPAPLAPKLFNSAVGALCVVLIAQIGGQAFRSSAGRVAGLVACVFPTLVVWSIVTLKEMLVLFAILVALRATQRLGDPLTPSGSAANASVLLVAALALVNDLRGAFVFLLLALVPIAIIGRLAPRVSRKRLALVVLGLGLAFGGLFAFARTRPPENTLYQLTTPEELARTLRQRRSFEAAAANSTLLGTTDVSERDVLSIPTYRDESLFSFSEDVVRPVTTALFAPAPWQVRGPRDLVVSAEMIIWYVLLAGAVVSFAAHPRQPVFVWALLVYAAGTLALLSLAEGNLGNLLRHRMMLTPPILILGSAGLIRGLATLKQGRSGTMLAFGGLAHSRRAANLS